MKTFLLLAISSVTTTSMLPNLPAKLIVSAFVLTAALAQLAHRAPVGYQDEGGFHFIRVRRAAAERRRAQLRLWRARKKLLSGWFFPDSRRTAKA